MLSRHLLPLLAFVLFPPCASAQIVYDGNQYLPPFGSYSGSNFDIVSLQNGNIHIRIPIASVQQRHGTVSYAFVYDTPDFTEQTDTETDPQGKRFFVTTVFPSRDTPGGWLTESTGDSNSWGLVSPTTQQTCSSTSLQDILAAWTVTDPQGGRHPLPLVTGGCSQISTSSGPALDGSGIFATVTEVISQTSVTFQGVVTLKDGTTINMSGKREDANGNQIVSMFGDDLGRTLLSVVQNGPAKTFTTPLGKTINSTYTSSSLNIEDSTGTPRTYLLDYTAIDVQTSVCTAGQQTAPNSCSDYTSSWLVPFR